MCKFPICNASFLMFDYFRKNFLLDYRVCRCSPAFWCRRNDRDTSWLSLPKPAIINRFKMSFDHHDYTWFQKVGVLSLEPPPPLPLKLFFGQKWENLAKNGYFWKFFDQPSRFSQICCKISWNILTPPPLKFSLDPSPPKKFFFGRAHVWS